MMMVERMMLLAIAHVCGEDTPAGSDTDVCYTVLLVDVYKKGTAQDKASGAS